MNRNSVASALAILALAVGTGRAIAQQPTTPRPARELVADAVKRAASEEKTVLVKFSASWCGPCRAMDRFLNDTTGVGAIMAKHFIVVALTVIESPDKVALENPGGVDLAAEMGAGKAMDGGIPWFFMVDGRGKKLGDSDMMPNHGNMGYPETVAEVEGFDRLLQTTAPRMTAEERARIKTYLDKAAGRPPKMVGQ